MLKSSVTCRGALLTLLVLQLSTSVGNGEPNKTLTPAGVIALGPPEGWVGPIAADKDGRHLYVAEGARGEIVAIDTKGGKEVARTADALGMKPGGAAFMPDSDRLLVSCAGRITLYDGKLSPAGVVENLGHVSCARYDAVSKLAYVGHESPRNSIAVVDPTNAQKVGDIELDGYPHGFQLEAKGNRMFVNVPSMQQIAVIDRQKRTVVAIWPAQDPRWSFPENQSMALDEEHHRLFVGCRSPAKLMVIDTNTGRLVSTLDCCPTVGDIHYDARRKRIYASGDEYVSVFRQADPDTYKIIDFITTGARATSSLFVPATGKFYVAVPDANADTHAAELLVFDCGPEKDESAPAPPAAK